MTRKPFTLSRNTPRFMPWITLASLVIVVSPAAAQDAQGVDFSRAYTADRTIFEPFEVTGTVPLRDALAEELLDSETALLVLEHEAGRIALVTDQLAYHHVAQGKIVGEPWMVSF